MNKSSEEEKIIDAEFYEIEQLPRWIVAIDIAAFLLGFLLPIGVIIF